MRGMQAENAPIFAGNQGAQLASYIRHPGLAPG